MAIHPLEEIQQQPSLFSSIWNFAERYRPVATRVIKAGLQVFGLASLGYSLSGNKGMLFSTGLGLIMHNHFPIATERAIRAFAAGNMLLGGGVVEITHDKNIVHKTARAFGGATIATLGALGSIASAVAFRNNGEPDPLHIQPLRDAAATATILGGWGLTMIGTGLTYQTLGVEANGPVGNSLVAVSLVSLPIFMTRERPVFARWQNVASQIATIALPFSLGTFSSFLGAQTVSVNLAIVLGDLL